MRTPNLNSKALVLLSGGQDSATCLLWAIAHCGIENVQCIAFNYGQKHGKELDCAMLIANAMRVKIVFKDCRGLTASSALTDHSQDVSAAHSRNPALPATFTPGRNALFLTIAAAHAYEQGLELLITGVCETDYSGYPDCRERFITQQERALQLAMEYPFKIITPLMQLTKAQTWQMAKSLSPVVSIEVAKHSGAGTDQDGADGEIDLNWAFEIVRTKTLTDYNGDTTPNEWGMGREDNPSSKLRAAGYREAKAHGWV